MNRRQFGRLAFGALGGTLSGCALPDDYAKLKGYFCEGSGWPSADEMLRVDMHCHLLNQDDANSPAFVTRRFGHISPAVRLGAATVVRGYNNIAGLMIDTPMAEVEFLHGLHERGLSPDPRAFCEAAAKRQKGVTLNTHHGVITPVGGGRETGFISNRTRNAALMIEHWPNVDIFTPSMVDFFETGFSADGGQVQGRKSNLGSHPIEKAQFYRALNWTTHGRFLPLVSFNPMRQVKDKSREMDALQLVRTAIKKWGFIGVKLHNSAGFNPIDNENYGCPNTFARLNRRLTPKEGRAIDEAMYRLYDMCDELEVPILAHGSDSLAAHPNCMHGAPWIEDPSPTQPDKKYPLTWTGASAHWINALDRFGGLENPGFHVCLAHLASRFQNHTKARDGFYANEKPTQPPVEYDADGRLIPSEWLAAALKELAARPDGRLWIDLSYMVALVYSEAQHQGEEVDSSGLFSLKFDDDGKYARAFRRFLEETPSLHNRLMYGSDWHMPEVSAVGPRYLPLMESVLPAKACEDIMGRNAVRFFGLQQGGKNRQRLEAFYPEAGVPLEKIRWMQRVDDRMHAAA